MLHQTDEVGYLLLAELFTAGLKGGLEQMHTS